MVSRGGRSRGCSNCRCRKVKCDETRPTCLRCKKRGLDCDGPRDHAWVDHSNSFTTNAAPKLCNTSICRTNQLSLTAFEEDICLAYTRRTFLRGGQVVELACNKIDFQEGSLIFLRRPELSLLRKAILSLSVIFFGYQHHEAQITKKGFSQYGEVLKEFNTALAVPERRTTNETLLTALTCMLLEMLSSTRPVNFLKHQRGIEAIMRLKGPPTDSTGETAMIYRGLRIFSIISALVEPRPSIYVEEDWKHAPVAEQTDLGMLQHKILAVLAVCTALTRDRDTLLGTKTLSEHQTSFLVRINNTMVDLDALYPWWERINQHQLHEREHKSRLADDLGIANHLSATVYMLYYTVRICILQLRYSVNPTALDVELRNDSAAKIAACLELKEYEKRNGHTRSNIIGSVATKVAWQAVGDFDTPEGQRLARAVLSSTHGSHAATVGIMSMPDTPSRSEDNTTFFAQLVEMATSSAPGKDR